MYESGKIFHFFFLWKMEMYVTVVCPKTSRTQKKYSLGSTLTKYSTVYDKRHLTFTITIVKHTLHYTVFL